MMLNLIKNIFNRIDYKPTFGTLIELLGACSIYPAIKFADPSYFVEDGWVENIQLVILVMAVVVAWKAPHCRPLFIMAAMVVILLLLRETNMFRSYFCAKYLSPDEICKWRNLKYGKWVDVIRILLVAWIIYYGIRHKVWVPAWQYIAKAPIYIWEFVFMFIGALFGILSELPQFDNEILEECAETLFYLAFLQFLWRYTRLSLPQD